MIKTIGITFTQMLYHWLNTALNWNREADFSRTSLETLPLPSMGCWCFQNLSLGLRRDLTCTCTENYSASSFLCILLSSISFLVIYFSSVVLLTSKKYFILRFYWDTLTFTASSTSDEWCFSNTDFWYSSNCLINVVPTNRQSLWNMW